MMLDSAFRKVRYGILLIKNGGLWLFWHHLKRQIYSRTTFWVLERNLQTDNGHIPCGVQYSLHPASREDMEEALQISKSESRKAAYDLIQRKWFYESGFHDCYVARTADTNDLCHIQWLVSSADEQVVSRGFRGRFPRLREDEVLVENVFTFEKYRGKGIMPSAIDALSRMARGKGFKRMLTCVSEDNTYSLRGFERAGFRKFDEIRETRFLFSIRRKQLGN